MMTEKRFQIDEDGDISEFENQQWIDTFEYANGRDWNNLCKRLNELFNENEQLKQEVSACYDTLTTIQELCYVVLNHDFRGVESKVDYCHMLNDMDNKDLAFLKECFEAIQNCDLMKMTQLMKECKSMTESIHETCENYSPKKDYCLKFFKPNISSLKECQEKTTYNDKELQRKWSN